MLVYEHVELAPPNAARMIERCVALSAQGSSSPAEALVRVGSAAAGVLIVARREESDDGGEHAVELDRSALEGSLVEDGSAQNEAQTLAIVLRRPAHGGSQRDA